MLQIEHLSKSFRRGALRRPVLDDVSIDVPAATISGVVGPSGSGKSTLARCVNLLERPDSGSVRIDGLEMTGLRGRGLALARRRTGMIFQSSSLLAHRTAAGNVSFALEIGGVDRRQSRRRTGELLERVGLTDHADAYPSQLSGGQRQRVGIARALAMNPAVLLADEATSGLDPETTASILTLLRVLRADLDLTILLITHEMEVVRRYCDHAGLLEGGRLVETGRVAELVADPASGLGRLLYPFPPTVGARTGETELAVVLRPGREEWLAELAIHTGTRARLLAAAIESVGPSTGGTAVIAVPDGDLAKALGWLRDQGLHVQLRDAGVLS
ncbi:methionine ABC transporter ATP-binding protein [Nocardia sp. NPDC057227]|uniref:methionine ABC transporter ATP-binding protein n=1 Tax=Nocardia sp. NPDC057227 TaxID=3346056 RepID=UPI003631261A